MVSEFRKKKLLHVFNSFFDTDRSGKIDQNDFVLAVDNIAKVRGWAAGEFLYEQSKKIAVVMWEGLQSLADNDKSGEVTADEWIALWDKFTADPESGKEWQELYCKFMFQLEDIGNDGKINSDEFSKVYEAFSLKKEESVEAFKKLSSGKDEVTWEEFQALWKEYFASEDQSAPGNYIFGKYA